MQPADHAPEIGVALARRLGEFRGERAQIAAGHEVPAGTAQHDDAQRVVRGNVGGRVDQRVHQREVERVEGVGTVERQRRDGAVAFDEERGGHGSLQEWVKRPV